MDKIADRIFSFEGDGLIEDFQGGYTMYVDWKERKKDEEEVIEEKKVLMHEVEDDSESVVPAKAYLSYHEKKEFDSLMRQIAKGEERKHEINTIFQTEQLSHAELKKLGKELQLLAQDLEDKEERRMELSERA